MIHQPIVPARPEPLDLTPYLTSDEAPISRHPMARPAPAGVLHSLVLHARTKAVQDRLEAAIYAAGALLVVLIASGYIRAALAGRL
ncbi:hypothetical protein [uncultured Sphingomonas sp.]|uniref:hypothetical protein n=1 Tax=uncultured Sphingomonas sp. TaxID=158754 RepID=UPI0035CB9642